jgi:hypothetical protein
MPHLIGPQSIKTVAVPRCLTEKGEAMARLVFVLVILMAGLGASADELLVGLPLTGEEAVAFLRSAEVVGQPEAFDSLAITEPARVSMTDGERTLRAIFKDENVLHRGFRFGDGREVAMIRDSYKHEIAAFELDMMLGLGLVPPCVERTLFKHTGSLCLWVENAMGEDERRQRNLEPDDDDEWVDQMILLRVFQQLISDQDFSNIRNILVDENLKVYKVDSSMGFYADPKLLNEKHLTRFSRRLLETLESLDRKELETRLKPWLYKNQINALWERRERILELADKRVAKYGEDAVLY